MEPASPSELVLVGVLPVRYTDGCVYALDQRLLPGEERELCLATSGEVAEAIRTLAVRGAPLIGITAAYGVALAAEQAQHTGATPKALRTTAREASVLLASTRPTARDLFRALQRMEFIIETAPDDALPALLLTEARAIHETDLAASAGMASCAAEVFTTPGWAMTICNTGALATGGGGTALAVITEGWRRGLVEGVYALETRPLLQGARLTAWELARAGIPHQVICDSAAADVLARREVCAVLTGADRIARSGDTANKVGTYMLALLAKCHRVPFYICAPSSTFDTSTPDGAEIPIEQRAAEEVNQLAGQQLAPAQSSIYNPAFDVTPGGLITAHICEHGVFPPERLKECPAWNCS